LARILELGMDSAHDPEAVRHRYNDMVKKLHPDSDGVCLEKNEFLIDDLRRAKDELLKAIEEDENDDG